MPLSAYAKYQVLNTTASSLLLQTEGSTHIRPPYLSKRLNTWSDEHYEYTGGGGVDQPGNLVEKAAYHGQVENHVPSLYQGIRTWSRLPW